LETTYYLIAADNLSSLDCQLTNSLALCSLSTEVRLFPCLPFCSTLTYYLFHAQYLTQSLCKEVHFSDEV